MTHGPSTPLPAGDSGVPADPGHCPLCQTPRAGAFCAGCGFLFPDDGEDPPAAPARLNNRYEPGDVIALRGDVVRSRGLDHGAPGGPAEVVIVREKLRPRPAEQTEPLVLTEEAPAEPTDDEILPTFDFDIPGEPAGATTPGWPGIDWEVRVIDAAGHPALPRVLDRFTENGFDYLIESAAVGVPLPDAWADPEKTAGQRFGWLKSLAEAAAGLHRAGVILGTLRPDSVLVTPDGAAKLADLTGLLPVPVPPDAVITPTRYTAPELLSRSPAADARADLYAFGALLTALYLGRDLGDDDFGPDGVPKAFIPQFPDAHPVFARLIGKTFCHEPGYRFPTEEAVGADPSGIQELIRNLEVCRQTLDDARLDIAAWTTTGMVRSGNEDAVAVLHGMEARQDDLGEFALVLLADGMGGYEAGEVAAGLAVHTLRRYLLAQPEFAGLTPGLSAAGMSSPGEPEFWASNPGLVVTLPTPLPSAARFDVESCRQTLLAALKHTNRTVYAVSRSKIGKRGMGCTAEAVYVNGRYVVVGHVGDSRTYHISRGSLVQLTRDQTLVHRLVELGQLTPQEAETHPRRSELQQAIGGQPDVVPGLYHARLVSGDWVVVCSDGLTAHVDPDTLLELVRSASSAEMAARRLVNLANLQGATDNTTVVVVRVQ